MTWRAFLTLSIAALAGCHSGPYVNAHLESVNAEYRQLEDYVYCLEEENSRLQQEVDEFKTRGTTSGSSSGGRRSLFDRSRGSSTGTPPTGDPSLQPPQIEGVPSVEPPLIEMPEEPSNTPPRRTQRPDLDPPPQPAEPNVEPLPIPARPAQPAQPQLPEPIPVGPADSQVTHLFVNPLLTGGADLDGQPGDDGLSVVLEPRNATEEFVPQAGAVSVVVLDPTKPGETARIARWDFDLSTIRAKLQTVSAGRGIHLAMPWPGGPPTNPKLHLFVRYEGPDGRKLQADREIFLTPTTAGSSKRWTPRPPERARPAEPARVAAPQPVATPQLLAAPPAAGQPTRQPAGWSPYR